MKTLHFICSPPAHTSHVSTKTVLKLKWTYSAYPLHSHSGFLSLLKEKCLKKNTTEKQGKRAQNTQLRKMFLTAHRS